LQRVIVRGSYLPLHQLRNDELICIEALSPEDTWAKIRERLDEYLAMGVEHAWCFEPESREVRRYTAAGFDKVTAAELVVEGTAIRVGIAEVFRCWMRMRNRTAVGFQYLFRAGGLSDGCVILVNFWCEVRRYLLPLN